MRALALAFAGAVVVADAAQIQIPWKHQSIESLAELDHWDLNTGPKENATDNLIFDTASSLLQRWANTRWRNGHTIIPGTVPVGTIFYHGRSTPSVPSNPEWLATDPEHAYMFTRGDGYLLTLVATRPLKVLYFDGSSAAKVGRGEMDSQEVVIYGEVKDDGGFPHRPGSPGQGPPGQGPRGERNDSAPHGPPGDVDKITKLCEWGKDLGIDGYMRMEMDFEIMLCDFTNGMSLVSSLHVDSGGGGPGPRPNGSEPEPPHPHGLSPPPPPHFDGAPPPPPHHPHSPNAAPGGPPPGGPGHGGRHSGAMGFEVIAAGSWHNDRPGETRVRLDYSKLLTFYDPSLGSLVDLRFGKSRGEHRLKNISVEDGRWVKGRVTELVAEGGGKGSGVDWKSMMEVVKERFGERLEVMRYILDLETRSEALENASVRVERAKTQVEVMLKPYLTVDAVPPKGGEKEERKGEWAKPIFQHCATAHTKHIEMLNEMELLTREEGVLLGAIRGVNREICRVVTRVWVDAVTLKLEGEGEEEKAGRVVRRWFKEIRALMEWLDWSVWHKCRPACNEEEICYLPTWPMLWSDKEEEWKLEAKPRCVRRIEPYTW